jgi:hypothetical protein
MQGNRVKAMMAFIVLVGLVGCKPDIPKLILIVNGVSSTKPDVRTMVRPGTVMTWHANSQFWVVFDQNQNPCDPSTTTDKTYVYKAQQVSGGYEATCTMAKAPVGKAPYEYNISPDDPTIKTTPLLTGHCEGCMVQE